MKKQIDAKSYIFLDESGKPETFSRKGTNLVQAGTASRYLVISAVRNKRPFSCSAGGDRVPPKITQR